MQSTALKADLNLMDIDMDLLSSFSAWADEAFELTMREETAAEYCVRRGEIWTCDFGQNVGAEINNLRPVVIVSKSNDGPTVVVAPLTRTNKAPLPTHVQIKGKKFFTYTLRPTKGTIVTEQIRTVSKARLKKKVGKTSPKAMKKINKAVKAAVGLKKPSIYHQINRLFSLVISTLFKKDINLNNHFIKIGN